MYSIELRNVTVAFHGREALHNVTVQFPEGLSLIVGPNGAGKTTLVRVIAGLVDHLGEVFLGSKRVNGVPPSLRGISYVPQSNALIPTLKVWQNIALGLVDGGYPPKQIRERVEQVARLLGIAHLLDRYPVALSGGEARRVAIARALVTDSEVLLMDEPELSVDAYTWGVILSTLEKLVEERNKTVLLTTHNFEDLLPSARALCVLYDGYVVFSGRPINLETSELPLRLKSWLGTTARARDILCWGPTPCHTVGSEHTVCTNLKWPQRDCNKVLILPKYVRVRRDGLLAGEVKEVLRRDPENYALLLSVNGIEIVATHHKELRAGDRVNLHIERVVPLC